MLAAIKNSPDVVAAKDILKGQGYERVEESNYKLDVSGYALSTYAYSTAFRNPDSAPAQQGSVADFIKKLDGGDYHLVSILVDSAKPNKPFLTGFTASHADIGKRALKLAPLPGIPVSQFVQQIGTESVADYLAGHMRGNPAGRGAAASRPALEA